jgi:hypothetical protein
MSMTMYKAEFVHVIALRSKTPMETSKEREKRERDEAILKAWDERIRMAKRPRDGDQVKIAEPAAKKARTGKDRIIDEDEDDEVVIVEAPTRDKKEEEERCLRNREERQLRLLKAGIRV